MNISINNRYCLILVVALLCTRAVAMPNESALTQAYNQTRDKVHATYKNLTLKFNTAVKQWYSWLKDRTFYQKKHYVRIDSQFTFDDIIGHDYAKERLGDLVKYIQNPEHYDRTGLTPPMTYVLHGYTYTGKSMFIEALAGEIKQIKGGNTDDFPIFLIDARSLRSFIDARPLGSERNFEFITDLIKKYAPCIIVIDAIDALNLHRKFKDKNALLSEFLSTISGCLQDNPDKKVIFIATTNNLDDLDPGIHSRFVVNISFDWPSLMHRIEYIVRELESKGLPLDQFDVEKLAAQTESCSYEELHRIINNAQSISQETGHPVTQADIERSMKTMISHMFCQQHCATFASCHCHPQYLSSN